MSDDVNNRCEQSDRGIEMRIPPRRGPSERQARFTKQQPGVRPAANGQGQSRATNPLRISAHVQSHLLTDWRADLDMPQKKEM